MAYYYVEQPDGTKKRFRAGSNEPISESTYRSEKGLDQTVGTTTFSNGRYRTRTEKGFVSGPHRVYAPYLREGWKSVRTQGGTSTAINPKTGEREALPEVYQRYIKWRATGNDVMPEDLKNDLERHSRGETLTQTGPTGNRVGTGPHPSQTNNWQSAWGMDLSVLNDNLRKHLENMLRQWNDPNTAKSIRDRMTPEKQVEWMKASIAANAGQTQVAMALAGQRGYKKTTDESGNTVLTHPGGHTVTVAPNGSVLNNVGTPPTEGQQTQGTSEAGGTPQDQVTTGVGGGVTGGGQAPVWNGGGQAPVWNGGAPQGVGGGPGWGVGAPTGPANSWPLWGPRRSPFQVGGTSPMSYWQRPYQTPGEGATKPYQPVSDQVMQEWVKSVGLAPPSGGGGNPTTNPTPIPTATERPVSRDPNNPADPGYTPTESVTTPNYTGNPPVGPATNVSPNIFVPGTGVDPTDARDPDTGEILS